ncbi:MAG TPA: nitroreductase family protein [Methanotrichaceae archaeon]|nr:nitroreductase family protein [Methanotrichaceae archaeon]
MEFRQVLKDRRSVRRYENRPVSRETISKLIDAAEAAPSAGNLRARKYVIITRKEMARALAMAAYGQSQIETAPLIIVVCADVDRSASRYGDRGSLYAIQDADAAIMCLLLAAHDMGLGACWNGAFDDQIVREALGLEEHILPVAIISLGWPAESPNAPPRRAAEELVSWVE